MSLKQTYDNIKSLKIQGATAIARTIINELRQVGKNSRAKTYRQWYSDVYQAATYLLSARPTEPMAQNLSRLILASLKKVSKIDEGRRRLIREVKEVSSFITLGQDNIIKYGQRVIFSGDVVFTHCHSSTVEKIIVGAKNLGKKIKVFNTETRPLYQGHITAKNLLRQKIDVTMVTDSAAGFLITSHSGREIMMDKILLGADVIFSNGSAVNKIGSLNVALAAASERVPVYIVAHLLKTDDDGRIEIERRSAREVWPDAPKGLEIINYAFDLIPAKYITGFITEFGIFKPGKIKKIIKKNYPWLLR